jgi:hypothetical protein
MAGTIQHMATALALLKHWEETAGGIGISSVDAFLVGNISPDSIMSRQGYQRSMKMHTHFRDGICDHDFARQDNLSLFHERIAGFAKTAFQDSSMERDLVLGYIAHILTDEIFMLTIRPSFMEKIAVLGLTDQDEETFEHFTDDVNQIDFRLVREYPRMERVRACLDRAKPYHITEMITEKEIGDSIQWILDFYFRHTPTPRTPVYYTYEEALEFIRRAVLFIDDNIRKYMI